MRRLIALATLGAIVGGVAVAAEREPKLALDLELLGPMTTRSPAIFTLSVSPGGAVRAGGNCSGYAAWPATRPFCQDGRSRVSAEGRARLRSLLSEERFFSLQCCAVPMDVGERRITAMLDGRMHSVRFLDLDNPAVPARNARAILRIWYGVLKEVTKDGKVTVLPEDERALSRK